MINEIEVSDEVDCEVLIKKYISLGYNNEKIVERLKNVDEKLFFIFNSPLKIR